jgi:hypothetical protein
MAQDLTGMFAGVFEDLKAQTRQFQERQQGPDHVGSALLSFVHSVNWNERWIQGILAVHAATILLAVVFRKSPSVQLTIFAWGAIVIFFSESLNRLGGEYWEEFATQAYFDRHGTFFSALVSLPLLLILVCVLVNYLCYVSNLMIKTKRLQLARQALQNSKADKKDS